MPNLISYIEYEEDGIDRFLCINCKSFIRIVGNYMNPILHCPYCGVKFDGGWIKDKKHTRIKWYNKIKPQVHKEWIIETKKLEYFNNDNPNNFWGDDDWEEVYSNKNCISRKELIKFRNKIIEEFKERYKKHVGYKYELYIRFTYRDYYNWDNKKIITSTKPKRIIVKGTNRNKRAS